MKFERAGEKVATRVNVETAKLVQRGYTERFSRTFGMWECNPCANPLDANSRLSKIDSPQVVDPALHRHCDYTASQAGQEFVYLRVLLRGL